MKLRVNRLADLGVVTLRDFQRFGTDGPALMLELGRLIESVRHGGGLTPMEVVPARRDARADSIDLKVFQKRVPLEAAARPPPPVGPELGRKDDSDLIFIPQEARGQPIVGFAVSVRLAHIIKAKGFRLLGDLHGLKFAEFLKYQNCGRKTVQELRDLVRSIQCGRQPAATGPVETVALAPVQGGCFFVPTEAHDLNPFELPISVRLETSLHMEGVRRLVDLHGARAGEFTRLRGCGKKTISELVRLLERVISGELQSTTDAFSVVQTAELLRSLEKILANLPPRNGDIFLLRLGAQDNRLWTLEEVGAKFGLTRERVRQVVEKTVLWLKKEGGPKLTHQLRGIASTCGELVCPLTPPLLAQWLGTAATGSRFSLQFWVRLLSELNPTIPAWPKGQEPTMVLRGKLDAVAEGLEAALQEGQHRLPLKEALDRTLGFPRMRGLSVGDFLEVLKRAKTLAVDISKPDQPEVRLRRLRLVDVAKAVLLASHSPLVLEEILARAEQMFGKDLVTWEPRTTGNALTAEHGFYLLGPRVYGLRRHFRLPESEWRAVRKDVQAVLKQQNHPVSTPDILTEHGFRWAEQTNKYELAQILREDRRFVDLGRLLFGLADWGIEEREYVKDLVPQILAEARRPMTSAQILERLRQLRSVSPYSLSGTVRKIPAVRDFGFGHFGLRSWGDAVKEATVADTALVERVIRRSEPPLSFVRLCEILEVPAEGALADKLWQTCESLSSVILSPAECGPNTVVLHKSCSLERALVATARAVSRPLPLYEFQWELNARFRALFGQKPNAELRHCLEQSRLFLRNADGEFILDIHLDQLGLDEQAIRSACLEILLQSHEIVGCDDLIEPLDAEEKVWEELSPGILGSLPREDEAFQEVGKNRRCSDLCASQRFPVVVPVAREGHAARLGKHRFSTARVPLRTNCRMERAAE